MPAYIVPLAIPAPNKVIVRDSTPSYRIVSNIVVSLVIITVLITPPSAPRALYFNRINVTRFLKTYNRLCGDFRLPEEERINRLLKYYIIDLE